jgi:hypothetical protein
MSDRRYSTARWQRLRKAVLHPGPGAQDGRKSQRRLDNDRYWNERRRTLIEEARVTTGERDGREYVVRHLAPQFGPVSEFPRASGVSNASRG